MTTDELQALRRRLGARLDARLSELRPGYDDSMCGFNEAWDVMRKFFDDEVKRIAEIETSDKS